MADSIVDTENMRIEEDITESFSHVPVQIRRWGISNILSGAFAYLFAWRENGSAIKLRATENGVLKVADSGGGFSRTETITRIATAMRTTLPAFSRLYNGLYVRCEDYPVRIWTSTDGITFSGPLFAYANQTNYFPFTALVVQIERAGLNDATCEVMGVI